jgi:M6 family metalloprotease-like protein
VGNWRSDRRPILRIPAILCTLPAVLPVAAAGPGPQCEAPPFRADEGLRAARAPLERPLEPVAPGTAPLRAAGSVHLLVILAQFTDLPARIDPARFQELLFGPERSVRDYYDEASGGRLALTGDIRGWVTLPGRQFDYSDGARGTGPYPRNGQKMAEDAVRAAIDEGLDLDGFDADENNVVDALLVVHSGQGWEWAGATGPNAFSIAPDPNAINSHKWVTVQREFAPGKPQVVDYFTCPELMLVRPQFGPQWQDSIATIGVYCHEFGHVLGLPDFYDTATLANHVGVWEIMDYGTWNQIKPDPLWSAPGAIPAHFSAWSKTFLGWADPAELAPGVGEEIREHRTLTSASLGGAPAQLLPNPFGVDWSSGAPGNGEYFLAEVRTLDGYDAGLPSAGLLIYHVDEARPSNSASANVGEARLLRLLPQDDSTSYQPPASVDDPWSGQPLTQTTFGPHSTPSSAFYDSSPSGVELQGISLNPDSSVSFTATVTNLTSTVPVPFARPNPWWPSVSGEVRIVVSLEGAGSATGRVVVYDVAGRTVRVLDASAELGSEGRVATWDGRDESGRPLSSGVYFFRAQTPGGTGPGKVILLR